MRECLNIIKALADENRVRTMMFLEDGELCVCQIIELLGLAPSTVSKHMSILYQAGLIESRKEGRWVYYRLADENASDCVLSALDWLKKALKDDAKVQQDRKQVKCVRKISLNELCAHYRNCQ